MKQLTGQAMIHAPLSKVYNQLLDPGEQLQWNSLYLTVEVHPSGEITDRTVMTGTFKGSGKATVSFEKVIPDREFTHHSRMMLFNLIPLGEFWHRYEVAPRADGTLVTQTVMFAPSGLGFVLASLILNGFRNRLPESFAEFKRYAEQLGDQGKP